MPSVKQLRKSLVAHNNKCKVKGVRKMTKAQLLTANRKVSYSFKTGRKTQYFSATKPRPKGLKKRRKTIYFSKTKPRPKGL